MPKFDKKDKSRYATFSRRMILVSGGMTAVFGVLAGRLYQLQIVEGEEYFSRAEDNRISERLVAAPRGRIFDRFGTVLADNRRNYRVLIVPEQAKSGVGLVLDTLGKVIPLNERERARFLKDATGGKPFAPVLVAENLDWQDFARLNLDLPYLEGVQPDIGEARFYPYGGELSQVVGYVAAVAPEDKEADSDPLLDVPGFRIGKRGIEKAYDQDIRGAGGVSRAEVNAAGRVIRELDSEPGAPGEDIYLTIDRELQHFIYDRLKDDSAAAVVMDVENGDVLAFVSTPGFDPNAFNVGVTQDEWKILITDERNPLLNKVMAGVYPPGSTFKTAVALAAIESGVATPEYGVTCTGSLNFGGHDFHCWKKGGHGRLNLQQGLEYSCDVFFYETARRTGIDKIAEAATALGLGAPTGIEIPGERSGVMPNRAWKEVVFKTPWQQGETLVAGIGQGYVTATPLQLCTMVARIASGKKISPRVTHMVGHQVEAVPHAEALPFAEDSLARVRAGMNAVTNAPGGTAYQQRITQPGFEMAGKTGTAQVRVISKEEHARGVTKNENLEWKLRDHLLFIAFAPVDKPRYAAAVVIEHGGAALTHPQVQLTRDALLFAQTRDVANRPCAYPVTDAGQPSRKA